jgi:hypothetical protein
MDSTVQHYYLAIIVVVDSKLVVTAGVTLSGALIYNQIMKFGKGKK